MSRTSAWYRLGATARRGINRLNSCHAACLKALAQEFAKARRVRHYYAVDSRQVAHVQAGPFGHAFLVRLRSLPTWIMPWRRLANFARQRDSVHDCLRRGLPLGHTPSPEYCSAGLNPITYLLCAGSLSAEEASPPHPESLRCVDAALTVVAATTMQGCTTPAPPSHLPPSSELRRTSICCTAASLGLHTTP
jgi:hypothetical protein